MEHCNRCRQAFSSCDDQLKCAKCRHVPGETQEVPQRCQEESRRGTPHWMCNIPALQTWMETASTSSDLISEVSFLSDSDISDLDFGSVNVEAKSKLVEVSVHQGPVEATSVSGLEGCVQTTEHPHRLHLTFTCTL